MSFPKDLGYRMPPEWFPHEATWLAWPKNTDTFPPHLLPRVESQYIKIIDILSRNERVYLLVDDIENEERVRALLDSSGVSQKNVFFYHIYSADVWTRDYAPLFIINEGEKKKACVKWVFNAWGNKYADLLVDNETGMSIARTTSLPCFFPGYVLEGGSIDVNGRGMLLTSSQCLLNRNRNPHLSKEEIEETLSRFLGISKVLWVPYGIEGDDTDGHIDDVARFVNEHTIVCAQESNSHDPNFFPLKEAFRILSNARDNEGEPFTVIPLPMPHRVEMAGRRLPATYANFYIANNAVLVPVFNDPHDEIALTILQECFPDREVFPIFATDIVFGYGGIHCITMQEPRI